MINVIYFASLKELFGKREESFDFAGKSVGELKSHIMKNYNLTGMDTYMTAVNEEFATNTTILNEGDTVAFIPPVSGG